jgi:hypothetical protein
MADLSDSSPWQTRDSNPAPAQRAKRICRKHNRREYEAEFILPGNVRYSAGTVIELDASFGPKFSGNFKINKVSHSWTAGEGYRITVEAGKVLKGY